MTKIAEKYGETIDFTNKKTYDAVGCSKCNNIGYYGRIGVFETLDVTEEIKELIVTGASTIDVRKKALEQNYKPLVVDGINKILKGETTLEELNRQLRESEPQTHDSWNADNIEDEEYRKKVRNTIKKLDTWLNEQIENSNTFDDYKNLFNVNSTVKVFRDYVSNILLSRSIKIAHTYYKIYEFIESASFEDDLEALKP